MRPITERSARELAAAIRAGELSSAEVVEAHVARLQAAAPRLNALVADRFEHARDEARRADELVRAARADGSVVLPPLLGVPFTVKETIEVAGMPNAAGVLARRHHRAARSAPAVQRLVDAGAIPLGVTNTSEMTLWIESDNPLYGRTSNPYDVTRTAGGSSGGEGATVGSGGSPFGLASDIAGSIRIPALFCGVFGHKPSAGLVPNTGLWPPSTGQAGRLLGVGPLVRRAEDLMPILRIIAGPDSEDATVRARSLGDPEAISLEGVPVTVLEDTARMPLDREVRDARERALGALHAAGAQPRRVSLRRWRRAVLPYLAMLQEAAGGDAKSTTQLLRESGEPEPTWADLLRGAGRHAPTTRFSLALDKLSTHSRLENGPVGGGRGDRMLARGRELARELLEAIGDGVVLHPAHPRPAPRHGRTLGRPWLLVPAAMFNLAGVPVTEVPLGIGTRGLPLGVQVAAAPDRDELTIRVALELERVFGGWVPPPR